MTRFASVVIDVDSTLSRIEGIEWLSARRSPEVQARVTATTEAAMRGDIALEAVYGERLAIVRPTRDEVAQLADAYIEAISPGAKDSIAQLRADGVSVAVVSGGLREALVPLAEFVGVPDQLTCAVSVRFDADGEYLGYDAGSPLARRGGKPDVVRSLQLPEPILALGDGITDAELVSVVHTFAAFAGVVRHAPVVAAASIVVDHFSQLPSIVLT